MDKVVPVNRNRIYLNNKYKFENKSQIFIFDLILSIVIIFVTIGIAFTNYSNIKNNNNIDDLTEQIINGFTETEINSLNNIEIRELFISGEIRNIHNTVGQQVIYFIENNEDELAKNLTKIFVKDYISKQTNLELNLYNSTDYKFNLYKISNTYISFNNSDDTSVLRRKIISFQNISSDYKMYTFEVKTWI